LQEKLAVSAIRKITKTTRAIKRKLLQRPNALIKKGVSARHLSKSWRVTQKHTAANVTASKTNFKKKNQAT
jgi:hypothetical protein